MMVIFQEIYRNDYSNKLFVIDFYVGIYFGLSFLILLNDLNKFWFLVLFKYLVGILDWFY